jgi:hypothetical protein
VPKKETQYATKDSVFPIAYTRDGYAKANLNIFIRNADFLKFLYTLARHLASVNYISRLATPPAWVAWEVWRKKTGKTAPDNPEESLIVDARIGRLVRAVASAVGDGSNPEETATRVLALNMALLRAMEDGTFHEISGKAGRVHAMSEVYYKFLRGEITEEELTAMLGSIKLSEIANTPPTVSGGGATKNDRDSEEKEHGKKQVGEDGVFARVLASLMLTPTGSKKTEFF